MKIAVEGCAHGALDKIYETLSFLQEREGIKVDLLLCCGDFQAVRNRNDLECMAVPPKYRQIETFYKYYSGEKVAPVLTVFIGGNHEASNHLWELPHGGWVAPNIYYLGYSGVVNFGGFRIAGLSGIYKSHDYHKGHFESPPYDNSSMRSAYHIRDFDVLKLKLLSQPVDIAMSHDWPLGVYHHGNLDKLFRYKGFLREEVETNTLGSPPAKEILDSLQPTYWFSAHLHVKFPALIPHQSENGEATFTKFLALDKCLPRRDFLQVLDVGPARGPEKLCYDPEWLAITKLTDSLVNITGGRTVLPVTPEEIERYKPTKEMLSEIPNLFNGDLTIPSNFVQTVEAYNPAQPKQRFYKTHHNNNPQTEQLCKALGIGNSFFNAEFFSQSEAAANPDEIDLGNDDDNDDEIELGNDDGDEIDSVLAPKQHNPEEIDINLSDEADSNGDDKVDQGDKLQAEKDELEMHTDEQEPKTEEGDNEEETSEPKKKIFKLCRRNQAIYTHDEDENTD